MDDRDFPNGMSVVVLAATAVVGLRHEKERLPSEHKHIAVSEMVTEHIISIHFNRIKV